MFIVLLRFSENKSSASRFMAEHEQWISDGLRDGGFLVTGTVPGVGGAVVVSGGSRSALDARVARDPFVREGVVIPEVVEIVPGQIDSRLHSLIGGAT
ncbi:hypothetical protein [Gordonia sp. 852002-51296_SCH5728562-b]|uniref:hypothetical protein n=1 Tax=Gordonia sp. 852002-51296_SCH5728562-b TaxID=1834101 RepID=UPI0007E98402|nr:hypothetical protein [Gordonia sp. 852002-51296_SCH5728562-b]OBA38212.1 hypothetical protein A5766_05460 [Gordonia sp. 852002-51296_SCH5728562-b]